MNFRRILCIILIALWPVSAAVAREPSVALATLEQIRAGFAIEVDGMPGFVCLDRDLGPGESFEVFVAGVDSPVQVVVAPPESQEEQTIFLPIRIEDKSLARGVTLNLITPEGHKARLAERFAPGEDSAEEVTGVIEGGLDQDAILAQFGPQLHGLADVLRLGMMFETQAMDIYTRLARRAEDESSRELFSFLAVEEARHLDYLADQLDRALAA